jgi:hypothetical protein
VLRIQDVNPGSRIVIFIHPGSNNSTKRGGEIFFVLPFFVATSIKKLKRFFLTSKENYFLANTQRIIVLFTQKFVIKLLKIWVWDPRSGKNLFRIPYPGSRVKKAPDPGSGSATLRTVHIFQQLATNMEDMMQIKIHIHSPFLVIHNKASNYFYSTWNLSYMYGTLYR